MPLNSPAPLHRLAYHANVNGVRGRTEELQRATEGYAVVALQDTRLRDAQAAEAFFLQEWPGYAAYSFVQDGEGPGCSLLVRATVRHSLAFRTSFSRHRLLGVELVLPDGSHRTVASLYVPPLRAGVGHLRSDLVRTALSAERALLLGDLNARSTVLGCRSTNANGDVLESLLDELGAVVLNDPGVPTFQHVSYAFQDCLHPSTRGFPLLLSRPGRRFGPLAPRGAPPLCDGSCLFSGASQRTTLADIRSWLGEAFRAGTGGEPSAARPSSSSRAGDSSGR